MDRGIVNILDGIVTVQKEALATDKALFIAVTQMEDRLRSVERAIDTIKSGQVVED